MKERASLFNLQSCGMHMMSAALQTGITSMDWNV